MTLLLLLSGASWPIKVLGANSVRIVPASVPQGATVPISVEVENSDPFVAFQADIPLPAGCSYVSGSAALSTARSLGHTLSVSIVGNAIRLIAFSMSNTSFSGSSGPLITFSLKAGPVPGNFPLAIDNTLLSDPLSQSLAHTIQTGTLTITGPNLQFVATTLDFGEVALTTASQQVATLLNSGNLELVISGLTFDDPQFSSPELGGFTLAAGASRQVTVEFAPIVKGSYSQMMTVVSNDPDTPQSQLQLHGTGFAVNELHCGYLEGASGSSGSLDFYINNMEPFTGFQFDLILPAPLTFNALPVTLFRGTDHIITAGMIDASTLRVVAYSPSGSVFTGSDGRILSLEVLINGVGGSYYLNLSNVIIANSTGENIVSAWSGNNLQITAPDIHSENALSFGEVSVLSSGNLELPVWNYGQEPLTITALQFNNPDFTSSLQLPLIIQTGQTDRIPVRFARSVEGVSTGRLQILSDDPDENPWVVNMSGTAFVPNYLVIQEQEVAQGDTLMLEVEASNLAAFVAFQFDLTFPEGLIPLTEKIALTLRKQDHVIMVSLVGDRTLRVVAWSPSQAAFTGSSGPLVVIPLLADKDMITGAFPLAFSNGVLSDAYSGNILHGMTDGVVNVREAEIIAGVGGFVFRDEDQLTDNLVDGIGTHLDNTLYLLLADSSDVVVASVPVESSGGFLFSEVPAGRYTLQVSTLQALPGSPLASGVLPLKWIYTGEHLGSGEGNDGQPDGRLSVIHDGVTPVTQARFGILLPPDIAVTLSASPNIMNGITRFNLLVKVKELENTPTSGTITILLPKDARWNLDRGFDMQLTSLDGTPVDNPSWSYSNADASYHQFQTTSSIAGGGGSTFGFVAQFDPRNTRGVSTITIQLVAGSGGEVTGSNNSDSEKLDYFSK
jgi:hypothetical protein